MSALTFIGLVPFPQLRVDGVFLASSDLVVFHKLRCQRCLVDRVLGEWLGQAVLRFGFDVGGGGYLDSTVITRVNVHAQELLRLVLHRQLESIAEDAEVGVGLCAASVGHPAVCGRYQYGAPLRSWRYKSLCVSTVRASRLRIRDRMI
eukprot:6213348-Pleurochrysis_carterae.AAC.1